MKMKMSKIVLWSLILVFALGIHAALAGKGGVSPWDAVWTAIADLQQQIDNIQLIPGPQGPQGEPGPIGPAGPSLKVVDANNDEVGLFLGYLSIDTHSYLVWNSSMDKLFKIRRKDASYDLSGSSGVTYYVSTNCTGQPYVESLSPDDPHYLFQMSSLSHLGWTHFTFDDYSKIKENFTTNSQWATGLQQCIQNTETHTVIEITQSSAPPAFVGPLRIVEQ